VLRLLHALEELPHEFGAAGSNMQTHTVGRPAMLDGLMFKALAAASAALYRVVHEREFDDARQTFAERFGAFAVFARGNRWL